jgi:glycosyltransferase involved in cell wall biosynthesis
MRLVSQQNWSKIHVVHCGLEPAFHDVAAAPACSALRLVCVGRLCEQKGQLLLMEAARRLSDEGRRFELVLAGDGDMRDELEALIGRYGLQEKVRITGWISSDQVRSEILAARALVLPSFAEGLPVVIMEAMALRRPVISTYVAGIPELIRPGEHGWLVAAGDVRALTDAMRDCLDADADRLAKLGTSARTRVLARHNIDTEVAKLIPLFGGTSAPGEVSPMRLCQDNQPRVQVGH